jgi:Glycosyl transferase family 2
MLSVIIATQDSERALVPTLAALVPGAMAGLVSEVLVADGGSRDGTAEVAEVAGCNFLALEGALARRLNFAAGKARARWLLFLRPGTVLEETWTSDAQRFMERPSRAGAVAVFRRASPLRAAFRDTLVLLAATLGQRPRPEQGLLIGKAFYTALGGHCETAADPESDLIRRIGRRRIVVLPAGAYSAVEVRDT